jgi:hypothetical protein
VSWPLIPSAARSSSGSSGPVGQMQPGKPLPEPDRNSSPNKSSSSLPCASMSGVTATGMGDAAGDDEAGLWPGLRGRAGRSARAGAPYRLMARAPSRGVSSARSGRKSRFYARFLLRCASCPNSWSTSSSHASSVSTIRLPRSHPLQVPTPRLGCQGTPAHYSPGRPPSPFTSPSQIWLHRRPHSRRAPLHAARQLARVDRQSGPLAASVQTPGTPLHVPMQPSRWAALDRVVHSPSRYAPPSCRRGARS